MWSHGANWIWARKSDGTEGFVSASHVVFVSKDTPNNSECDLCPLNTGFEYFRSLSIYQQLCTVLCVCAAPGSTARDLRPSGCSCCSNWRPARTSSASVLVRCAATSEHLARDTAYAFTFTARADGKSYVLSVRRENPKTKLHEVLHFIVNISENGTYFRSSQRRCQGFSQLMEDCASALRLTRFPLGVAILRWETMIYAETIAPKPIMSKIIYAKIQIWRIQMHWVILCNQSGISLFSDWLCSAENTDLKYLTSNFVCAKLCKFV